MSKKVLSGHVSLLIANIIFGANNPIARVLMPEIIDPLALTFIRFSGGMILFWLVSLFFKREQVPAKDKFLLFCASIFALSFNQLPFFKGLSMTSSVDASIVVTMLPIVTMIFSALILKEPITQLKVVGVLIGAAGALLLIFSEQIEGLSSGNMMGNLIVFSATVSFALYITLFKRLIDRYHPVTIMKWMFLSATITGLPFSYTSLIATDFTTLVMADWVKIGFVVFFATFTGYLLLPIGQKTLRPTTLSMYNYVQPIVASLIAILIGMDRLGYEQIISSVLVFSGVYIVTQSKSRAQLEEASKK
jgi:drug/metabolite transporter (DMT)-like permease